MVFDLKLKTLSMLPYGRHWIDDDDIAAVVEVMRSDWLTTGPKVAEFEGAVADCVGVREAVAVSSGTAALHAAMLRLRCPAGSRRYDEAFAGGPVVRPLGVRPEVRHAYHLYVVRLNLERLQTTRAEVFAALRAEGIGVNVHYLPVHWHPFYRVRFGTGPGRCPVAEAGYEQMLSLPIFPAMTDGDVEQGDRRRGESLWVDHRQERLDPGDRAQRFEPRELIQGADRD